ncbi:MAG: hypothetical protein L3J47_10060 [Sulfurovum sp.]|nr:hypothetical protein [Sulfurovum sp.]
MTIYQVVYYNQFGERVADFGYYEDKLDAEKRAFEVRMKTSPESGKVCIEDVFVHDSTDENFHRRTTEREEKHSKCYGLK